MNLFPKIWCSQCGSEFGPGPHGYSHCSDHGTPEAREKRNLWATEYAKPHMSREPAAHEEAGR